MCSSLFQNKQKIPGWQSINDVPIRQVPKVTRSFTKGLLKSSLASVCTFYFYILSNHYYQSMRIYMVWLLRFRLGPNVNERSFLIQISKLDVCRKKLSQQCTRFIPWCCLKRCHKVQSLAHKLKCDISICFLCIFQVIKPLLHKIFKCRSMYSRSNF